MSTWRNESGQVLIITALSMTILLGFVGFATDVGVMLRERRVTQTVADSAAVGAATEALNERFPSTVTTAMYQSALLDASLDGYSAGASNGTTNSSTGVTLTINTGSNITIPGYSSAGNIQAIVSKTTPTIFMGAFGALLGGNFQNINVSATAIASNKISSNGCGWIPNGNGYTPAVKLSGSSNIFANQCGISVNGNVDMGGSSNLTALYLVASGSVTNAGSSGISGPVASGGSYISDPMQYLQDPVNQPSVSGTTCTGPDGMNCKYDYGCGSTSCTISNTTLTPSTVYYYDKPLTISGNVSGTGNTIYLAGTTPYLDFNNVGTLTLSAPAPSGESCAGDGNPLCGIVIDAPADGSGKVAPSTCSNGNGNNKGNNGEIYFDFGSSTTTLKGIVYAPYMQLFLQDQGANTTFDNNFVIGTFCSQSATLNVNGLSGPLSPITRVGLVY
jgi:hypothetical protein